MPPISPLLPLPIGGGGIGNIGYLRLERVAVSGNHADFGAGIFNYPFSFLKHQGQHRQRQLGARGGRHPLRRRRPGRQHDHHGQHRRVTRRSPWSGVGVRCRDRYPGATPSTVTHHQFDHRRERASKGGGGSTSARATRPSSSGIPFALSVRLRNTIVADNFAAAGKPTAAAGASFASVREATTSPAIARSRSGAEATCRARTPASGRSPTTAAPPTPSPSSPAAPRSTRCSVGCPPTDQRGVPRPPGGCDIGAFQTVSGGERRSSPRH